MEKIKGFEFKLTGKILLIHQHKKCWEVSYKKNVVSFRVGNGQTAIERNIERRQKAYQSQQIARKKVIQKIGMKIDRGYLPKQVKSQSKQQLKPKTQPKYKWVQQKEQRIRPKYQMQEEQTACHNYRGVYLQNGIEAIRMELDGQSVTKIYIVGNSKEKKQVRQFKTAKLAEDWCLKEQQSYKSKGFTQNLSKFSLTRDKEQEQLIKVSPNSQFSLSTLTDKAIQRQNSKQSRRNLVSTRLGPPIKGSLSLLLAENFKEGTDPTGYYMSEKLDGVRCFWSGQFMYSRNGNKFIFPKFFTENWPASQLDGELFIGRGKFSQTLSTVKKSIPIQKEWENVRYLVFDAPGLKNQPFKTRIKVLELVLDSIDSPYIKCHAHRICQGVEDLTEQLSKITSLQGEGIMLRDPHSFYENKRSKSLLKVKTFQDDEATVLGYTDGQGRLEGLVGALRVRTDKGIQFQVGSGMTDEQRRNPPSIGSKITYRYFQFNKESGKPRFPTFVRSYEEDKIEEEKKKE